MLSSVLALAICLTPALAATCQNGASHFTIPGLTDQCDCSTSPKDQSIQLTVQDGMGDVYYSGNITTVSGPSCENICDVQCLRQCIHCISVSPPPPGIKPSKYSYNLWQTDNPSGGPRAWECGQYCGSTDHYSATDTCCWDVCQCAAPSTITAPTIISGVSVDRLSSSAGSSRSRVSSKSYVPHALPRS